MSTRTERHRGVNSLRVLAFTVLLAIIICPSSPYAQVKSYQKISDTQGGFTGGLDYNERFGTRLGAIDDLDGDGVTDLAVGAYWDGYDEYSESPGYGAVWILFLYDDGTVKSYQKITQGQGGFTGPLNLWDEFGVSVANLGDLDGDGVGEIAVGARLDDDGGTDRGAVWVLFMNNDGTVKDSQKISDTQGGFIGDLDDSDWFGTSLAWLGDIDGDGKGELAVGAKRDDDGGADRGAVWLLSLNEDGTVYTHSKISDTQGGFDGGLDNGDFFGEAVTHLGDLDGDEWDDIAVGAMNDDDGGQNRGGVWVLFLHGTTIKGYQKISATEGGFEGLLNNGDQLGTSLSWLPRASCAGYGTLAVGALGDDDGGTSRGAVWLLPLNSNGTVITHQKISDTEGGFTGGLDDFDYFSVGLASIGDFDGDGTDDISVGAFLDDDGGTNHGAVWTIFLSDSGCVVQPTSVDFDTVSVGSHSDGAFTIINTGCGTLIGNVSEACSEYDIVSGGGAYTLASGESLLVTVRFEPTTFGVHTCTVSTGIACDDVFLTGVAIQSPSPTIGAITDVGNDQGRRVRINFSRSGFDVMGSPFPILQYEAFRRIDPLPSPGTLELPAKGKDTDMVSDRSVLLQGWEFVGTVPAHVEAEYNMIAPTLADSTIADGVHWSVFFIRAATSEPDMYFDSAPDSGYSIDNLGPSAPQNLTYTEPGLLTWDEALEADFNYFSVYGSILEEFDKQAELIGHTMETSMDVQDDVYPFYSVTVTDSSGNEGPPATTSANPGLTNKSGKYALDIGTYPNPFNPETTIRYSIPKAGPVALRIYDAKGRLLTTLVEDNKPAGVYTATWRGRDQNGEEVSTGVYFARLEASGRARSIKVVFLK